MSFWGALTVQPTTSTRSPRQVPLLLVRGHLHSSFTVLVHMLGASYAGKVGLPRQSRGPQDLERNPGQEGAQNGECWVGSSGRWSSGSVQQLLSSQVLGFLFFAAACFLYKRPSGSSHGLEASLPSQSSASDNPTDLQDAPSALQLQSDV